MALNLRKGQKIDLTKGNPGLSKLLIGLGWDTNKYRGGYDFDLDVTAFLLKGDNKVSSNQDFVYYGNLQHLSGSVEHMGDNLIGGTGGDDEQIKVDLSRVPDDIERIAIAVTIYDADNRNQNFGQVSNAYIHIGDTTTNTELLRYDLEEEFSYETTMVVGEIYRYKGEWKFNAVGSGFKGGLKSLCLNYGVNLDIKDRNSGAVILQKGQKVNLSKGNGEILINLNWSQPERSGWGRQNGIDLDLGCLYELWDGRKGTVQALGNAFGSLINPPYISLDGDDRTGTSTDGENLRVNSAMIPQIKRILVYTFIYEGAVNWREAKGIVTVKCPGSKDIIVKMDEYGSNLAMCGIALLENRDGHSLSMEKVVRFFDGHRDLDAAFGWGLRWVVGSKD
ncbi:tellurium resistance protein TerA [Lachnoanaerobaculum umeaense]|jgi:putative tellurium resistance protein|uniref:Tellurium resistance protein TerA n=1 Tax=Lachnoanaerobaculum umeaense TaxID=617123 RepID=A0A385Q0R3_9FIRM|nr:TerD family protein [Lachnoanaerobaculum umeaense]AYA99329.1 tellurium resistance protein TerA [Lachnoanaerobaculum umeaense]PZW93879.1 tellurite resistance protein TerA [Lachnoanaerobaculum umeaense]